MESEILTRNGLADLFQGKLDAFSTAPAPKCPAFRYFLVGQVLFAAEAENLLAAFAQVVDRPDNHLFNVLRLNQIEGVDIFGDGFGIVVQRIPSLAVARFEVIPDLIARDRVKAGG